MHDVIYKHLLRNQRNLEIKFVFVGVVSAGASGGQAGAVDEELFQQSFEDVKPLSFHSSRSLQVKKCYVINRDGIHHSSIHRK